LAKAAFSIPTCHLCIYLCIQDVNTVLWAVAA
jgi:hypothetical protein